MSYARIDEGFWTDPKIKNLSPETKLIAAWLFTNPHRHFSGIYYLPKVLIAEEIGVSIDVSNKALKTLENKEFIKYSDEYSVVWVIKMLPHQTGGGLNEKQAKGIIAQLKTLHGCPLIKLFLETYQSFNIPFNTPINTPTDTKSKSKSKSKSKDTPPTPSRGLSFSPQKLAELWNDKAPPELRRVTLPFNRKPKDMEKIRDALKRNPGAEWWERVILLLHDLPFVRGQNDRSWKITLDVMVRDAEKILDGKYAGGKPAGKQAGRVAALQTFLKRGSEDG